jgi:hypothetical protein
VTIKGILIAAGIIAVALLLMPPHSETAAPHDTGTNSVTTPRTPYPCESDHSAQCTWDQYRQLAEEDCAKDRAQGGQCEIVTNDWPPHAVHISSEGERADIRRRIDEGVRRLCDNLAHSGYGCHAGNN